MLETEAGPPRVDPMDFFEHFLLQAVFFTSTMPSSFSVIVKEQVQPLILTSSKVSRTREVKEYKTKLDTRRQRCQECISIGGLVGMLVKSQIADIQMILGEIAFNWLTN